MWTRYDRRARLACLWRKQLLNRRAKISFALLLASIAFFWMDLPLKLRATNPAVDYAVYAVFCFLVPASIVAAGWAYRKTWLRALSVIITLVIGVPTAWVGEIAFGDATEIYAQGYDSSLELMQEAAGGAYYYRLYRTNCGALCACGLELRKEYDTPFGFKLVRTAWSFYGAEEGSLALSAREVRISYNGTVVGVPR